MKQVLYVICFLIAILSVRCSDNPCEPCPRDLIYPLTIGYRWEYACIDSMFNFRYDSQALADDVFRDTSIVEVARLDTLPGGIETSVLHETKRTQWGVYEAEDYYRNKQGGLYHYAFRGFSDVMPFRPPAAAVSFRGREFRSMDDLIGFLESGIALRSLPDDSLHILEWPTWTLKYPLRIGSRWDPNPAGAIWPIEKVVLGEETTEVPAGTYRCLVVQLLHDLDEDGEWDTDIEILYYICEHGLIRRHVFLKDLLVSGEFDDTMAVYDAIVDSDLTSVSMRRPRRNERQGERRH